MNATIILEAAAVAAAHGVVADFAAVYDIPKATPPAAMWVSGTTLGALRGAGNGVRAGTVKLLISPRTQGPVDALFSFTVTPADARAFGEALIAQADAVQSGAV